MMTKFFTYNSAFAPFVHSHESTLYLRMPFLGALAGVGKGLLRTYVTYNPGIHYTFKGQIWNGQGTPPALNYYGIPMVSIYSSDFVKQLLNNISTILSNCTHESPYFNLIIEVLLKTGQMRTVGQGFIVTPNTNLQELEYKITAFIEAFETQSGTPEERQPEEVVSSLIKVMNRSEAPAVNWENPLELPHSEKSPLSNFKNVTQTRTTRKNTEEKLAIINSQLNILGTELKASQVESTSRIVEAIRESKSPALFSNVNWTPILQGKTMFLS
jgi:hypothetical protein